MDSPAKFPCMVLIESDNYTHEESLNSEMREHNANLMYTLDIYSNKTSGAKQECKKYWDYWIRRCKILDLSERLVCQQGIRTGKSIG